MANAASPKANSSAPASASKTTPPAERIPVAMAVKPEDLAIEIYDSLKKQMNSPIMKEKLFFLTKVALVFVCYTFLTLNSLYDFVSPDVVPECIQDKMQDLTLPLNQHLAANPTHKNLLIIFASFMIDLNVFVMSARWIVFGKNFKTFMTIGCFYAVRGFMQSVFFMGFPSNYIWSHPGIFSVTVPYQPANDFFFSGHVGLCVICFIDFKREKVPFMKEFAFVSIFVEFFVLLVTRAHYFIDLATGLVVSHYIYLCCDWVYAYLQTRKEQKASEAKAARKEVELVKNLKQKEEKSSVNKKPKKGTV